MARPPFGFRIRLRIKLKPDRDRHKEAGARQASALADESAQQEEEQRYSSQHRQSANSTFAKIGGGGRRDGLRARTHVYILCVLCVCVGGEYGVERILLIHHQGLWSKISRDWSFWRRIFSPSGFSFLLTSSSSRPLFTLSQTQV